MTQRKNETRVEYLVRRKQWRSKPKSKQRAREDSIRYRLRNPETIKRRNKANYLKNGGARGKLKRTYGITPAQYDEMNIAQGGLCAACGSAPRSTRPLCVDHCHKTKVIRGLICDACNVCAGHIESQRYGKVLGYLARTADPYSDNWPDAAQNSAGSYATAIEALRRKREGG